MAFEARLIIFGLSMVAVDSSSLIRHSFTGAYASSIPPQSTNQTIDINQSRKSTDTSLSLVSNETKYLIERRLNKTSNFTTRSDSNHSSYNSSVKNNYDNDSSITNGNYYHHNVGPHPKTPSTSQENHIPAFKPSPRPTHRISTQLQGHRAKRTRRIEFSLLNIMSRRKRHAAPEVVSEGRHFDDVDNCPVSPDTPVILRGREVYFNFSKNEQPPSLHPERSQSLVCPSRYNSWWTRPGNHDSLKAACPRKQAIFNSWRHGYEIYPRYVKSFRCICSRCIIAPSMGCKAQKRLFLFYRKTGCQGNKPVFSEGFLRVPVSCVCSR